MKRKSLTYRMKAFRHSVNQIRAELEGSCDEWDKWFAWYPVETKHRIVWMQTVWRKATWEQVSKQTTLKVTVLMLKERNYMTDQEMMAARLTGEA